MQIGIYIILCIKINTGIHFVTNSFEFRYEIKKEKNIELRMKKIIIDIKKFQPFFLFENEIIFSGVTAKMRNFRYISKYSFISSYVISTSLKSV